MEESAAELVRGMQLAIAAVGAREGVIGIKGKKKHAVEAVTAASQGTNVRVQLLGDYYPAGDEYDLVYNVTGKLIPPGGIPLAVGVVVNNVETFVNIAAAHDGRPLTAQNAHHRRRGEIARDHESAARHHLSRMHRIRRRARTVRIPCSSSAA